MKITDLKLNNITSEEELAGLLSTQNFKGRHPEDALTWVQAIRNFVLMPRTPKIKLNDLSVLAYANNFTLWHFKAESKSDFYQKGFFNPAHDMMQTGDLMIYVWPTGTILGVITVHEKDVSITSMIKE